MTGEYLEEYKECGEPKEEKRIAITQNLKNKRAGDNEIKNEMLKYSEPELHKQISKLVKEIWKGGKMPTKWKNAVLCLVLKKGDRTRCENYREVVLLDTVYKVLAISIRNTLKTYVDEGIQEYQCGFSEG